MKPDPEEIIKDMRKMLKRFKERDRDLQRIEADRFGKSKIDIPPAYQTSSKEHHSPALQEEGRGVAALVSSPPTPHIVPPDVEDQPLTTKGEKFLMAMDQELEAKYGAMNWTDTLAQIHEKISWRYRMVKRKPYPDQPLAPDNEDPAETMAFNEENDAHKKEVGITAAFEERHVPTRTAFWVGNHWNPLAFYEIKDIDEFELLMQYGIRKDRNGKYERPDVTTLPSGGPRDGKVADRAVKVVEYWDRDWCMIVVQNPLPGWRGKLLNDAQAFVLEEWEHKAGRVPYFCRPAFENEVLEEEHKFESPLNGLQKEIGEYNRLRTIMSNVSYLTGFAPLKMVTKETGDAVLDDAGSPKILPDFEPGKIFNTPPGADVLAMVLSPEAKFLVGEVAASEARIRQYSLSDIAKGVSPGADTANAALSQLQRLQKSALQQMADNAARQAREMYRFTLQLIKDEIGETVFAFDKDSGDQISLSPEDIVTLNVQAEVIVTSGTDKLIEEKQGAEMVLQNLITPIEFHERRGKENPEEYVTAQVAWELFQQMKPQLIMQVMAGFGDTNAMTQLIQANQQTGDAKNAVQPIMEQMKQRQNGGAPPPTNGIGKGSPMMPRGGAVMTPTTPETTQPQLAGGP